MANVSEGGAGIGSYGTLTSDVVERKVGMVRATQDYLWSQTQAAHGGPKGSGSVLKSASSTRQGEGGHVTARDHARHVAFSSQTQSKMLAPRLSGEPKKRWGVGLRRLGR